MYAHQLFWCCCWGRFSVGTFAEPGNLFWIHDLIFDYFKWLTIKFWDSPWTTHSHPSGRKSTHTCVCVCTVMCVCVHKFILICNRRWQPRTIQVLQCDNWTPLLLIAKLHTGCTFFTSLHPSRVPDQADWNFIFVCHYDIFTLQYIKASPPLNFPPPISSAAQRPVIIS